MPALAFAAVEPHPMANVALTPFARRKVGGREVNVFDFKLNGAEEGLDNTRREIKNLWAASALQQGRRRLDIGAALQGKKDQILSTTDKIIGSALDHAKEAVRNAIEDHQPQIEELLQSKLQRVFRRLASRMRVRDGSLGFAPAIRPGMPLPAKYTEDDPAVEPYEGIDVNLSEARKDSSDLLEAEETVELPLLVSAKGRILKMYDKMLRPVVKILRAVIISVTQGDKESIGHVAYVVLKAAINTRLDNLEFKNGKFEGLSDDGADVFFDAQENFRRRNFLNDGLEAILKFEDNVVKSAIGHIENALINVIDAVLPEFEEQLGITLMAGLKKSIGDFDPSTEMMTIATGDAPRKESYLKQATKYIASCGLAATEYVGLPSIEEIIASMKESVLLLIEKKMPEIESNAGATLKETIVDEFYVRFKKE